MFHKSQNRRASLKMCSCSPCLKACKTCSDLRIYKSNNSSDTDVVMTPPANVFPPGQLLSEASLKASMRERCLDLRIVVCFLAAKHPSKEQRKLTLQNTLKQKSSSLSLLVGCLTSQQHASVCQGRICSDNFTCCHTEIEVADQTFHFTQSQYTDTGPSVPVLTL